MPHSVKPNLQAFFPENRANGLEWPYTQILVAENHRLLFCPIAKNACTSLKRLIISISDIPHKEKILEDVHRSIDFFRTGAKLLDFEPERAREIMASAEYFKFAVVRDPFARLVSAYMEKFVINRMRPGNQQHTGPVVAAVQGGESPDFQRGISFAEFVHFITAQPPERLDPHWAPQALYLRGIQYDRIYRMDQIDILHHDLANRIGHPVALEHKNPSHGGRPKYVPGAARLLPDVLPAPKTIDKHSFMESELMYHIADYFAADYRQYSTAQATGASKPSQTAQCRAPAHVDLLQRLRQALPRTFRH